MSKVYRLAVLITLVGILGGLGAASYAGSISLSCTPGTATANSVWMFEATWTDSDGKWPMPTPGQPAQGAGMIVLTNIAGYAQDPDGNWVYSGIQAAGGIPMYHWSGGDPKSGVVYRTFVSSGLNMSNVRQWPMRYITSVTQPGDANSYIPPSNENKVLWGSSPHTPLWYAPALYRDSDGVVTVEAHGYVLDSEGKPVDGVGTFTCTIRNSSMTYNQNPFYIPTGYPADGGRPSIDYSGSGVDGFDLYNQWVLNDDDWLSCFPDGFPYQTDVDPLSTFPSEYANAGTPDEGTGNQSYKFRINYHNRSGSPPLPWMSYDTWQSGVVLYIAKLTGGTPQYQRFPMIAESGSDGPGVYKFDFMPGNVGPGWTGLKYGRCYTTLEPGIYSYFFGCSDDNVRFPDSTYDYVLSNQPNRAEWGGSIDPNSARSIPGYPELDRPAGRRVTSGELWLGWLGIGPPRVIHYDDQLLLDRVVRAPGLFEDDATWDVAIPQRFQLEYPFKSTEYPKVTSILDMRNPNAVTATDPYIDDDGIAFDDRKYGFGRFFGTLLPFKRSVDPNIGDSVSAETCGATAQTENVFRILYRHKDGKAPVRAQIWISNGMGRSGAVAHAMTPDPVLNGKSTFTLADYEIGVWYSYKSKLTAGKHSYYFEFNDGEQKTVWPARPDSDPFVGGGGTANDYVPGPYVNTAPVLTNAKVTPATGKQGDSFVYSVTYQDADGQRPYSAYLFIETDNAGTIRQCKMTPTNPSQANPSGFKSGVEYSFDTGTLDDLVLQTGKRRYYFQFIDDWGTPNNPNDTVEGETVRLPTAGGSWFEGPVITGNVAPTLSDTRVNSADGTSNPATLWTYRVNYRDVNNDAPTVLKLYVGQLQRDGKTVLWDEGHAMLAQDTDDIIYSDGKEYYYQTRLAGVDSLNDAEKSYYYAFFASDGSLMSTYNSSTSEDARSNAASCFLLEDLQRDPDNQRFYMQEKIAQAATVTNSAALVITPTNPTDILEVLGVYATEDLGTKGDPDLYAGTANPYSAGDPTITCGSALPENGTTVWVEFGAKLPIFGMADMIHPTSVGVLGDAWLYEKTLGGDPAIKRLDGQRNGWAGADRFSVMKGLAVDSSGKASRLTVAPEFPKAIASIEGIYTDPDPSTWATATNYYNPAVAHMNAGDTLITLAQPLPAEFAGGVVAIEFSDIRFTYQSRGTARDIDGNPGEEYYAPDSGSLAYIKGISNADRTTGLVGAWAEVDRVYANYFDPWTATLYADAPAQIELTTNVPAGTQYMWARYYQSGEYHIDRFNRTVDFFNAPIAADSKILSTYMFGWRMPETIKVNTPPVLYNGLVDPEIGSQSTTFTFSVFYRDNDGPNGQPPTFVRVVVDGVPQDMTQVAVGTPVYSEGVEYRYSVTGLAGGSHTFYFEASDGAATTVLDTTPAASKIDPFNGPWVNDPPQLTNAQALPNDAAGIEVGTSVEFSVTYSDPDNDEPYFYQPIKDVDKAGNPVGMDVSGSPRLWLDSMLDRQYASKVAAIEESPAGQKRRIRIELAAGEKNPWRAGELAGSLMQFSSGSLVGRVYLIESNTGETITVATDNLPTGAGGIAPGDSFIVNGVLMGKADPTAYDFRGGVKYAIGVPRLAVLVDAAGVAQSHTFRITARSRENRPMWLSDITPYSRLVSAFGSGPLVVDLPPVLTTEGPLFAGPRVLTIAKIDNTKVGPIDPTDPGKFLDIRTALGVYITANADGDLATKRNYYDPASAGVPFAEGDTQIELTRVLPSIATDEVLVQFGQPISDVAQVIPERTDVIKSVLGVFIDPELKGVNYYNPATGSYIDGRLNLTTPLPLGTQQVYVRYTYNGKKDDTGKEAWPVYVKYFAKFDANTVFIKGENLTFRATYSDPDGDIPGYHDGVEGYIRLVTSDLPPIVINLHPVTPLPTDPDLLKAAIQGGVLYEAIVTDFPEGFHTYHLEASNGYVATRVPTDSADDYQIRINFKPVVSAVSVDPFTRTGRPSEFVFHATYVDKDGVAPPAGGVVVHLRKADDASVERFYTMAVDPSETEPDYTKGVKYVGATGTINPPPVGVFKVTIEARDDYEKALPVSGGNITIQSNHAPVILGYGVTPTSAVAGVDFTFTATYRDVDNDPPVYIAPDGSKQTAVQLIIDGNTAAPYMMTTADTMPDYSTPEGVVFTAIVPAGTMAVGKHKFTVRASDGNANAVFAPGVPFEILFPEVINSAPVIKNYFVTPTVGKSASAFVYSAYYYDADNDEPHPVTGVGGVGVTLYVDGKAVKTMVTTDLTPEYNSATGVLFTARMTASELHAGSHTYTVSASDGKVLSVFDTGVPSVKPGPAILVPYASNFRVVPIAKPTLADGITTANIGDQVLIKGQIRFPYDPTAVAPSLSSLANVAAIVNKPDGSTVSIPCYVSASDLKLVDDSSGNPLEWVAELSVSYGDALPEGDPAVDTGNSLTFVSDGTWDITMFWAGDGFWDGIPSALSPAPDVKVVVGGVRLTVPVADPLEPATSAPVIAMITPPMWVGSPDFGDVSNIFGFDRALSMQIVRWDPASRTYKRHGSIGSFEVAPGDALWIKPLASMVAESITQTDIDSGLVVAGNTGDILDATKQYRLIKVSANQFPILKDGSGNAIIDPVTGRIKLQPCTIQMRTGWNQFGSIFFNWLRTSSNVDVIPKVDVGIPLSEIKVSYLGSVATLSQAKKNGWIRDYAWRYDANIGNYVLVHPTAGGAERVVKAWSGYWIRTFVDCQLIVDPNTRYNGATIGAAPTSGVNAESILEVFDAPPVPTY